jgi:hypothetical protein
MIDLPGLSDDHDPLLTRRGWLAGVVAVGLAGPAVADDRQRRQEEERDLREVVALARKAGLGPLTVPKPTPLYQGIGNAPADFQKEALKL